MAFIRHPHRLRPQVRASILRNPPQLRKLEPSRLVSTSSQTRPCSIAFGDSGRGPRRTVCSFCVATPGPSDSAGVGTSVSYKAWTPTVVLWEAGESAAALKQRLRGYRASLGTKHGKDREVVSVSVFSDFIL